MPLPQNVKSATRYPREQQIAHCFAQILNPHRHSHQSSPLRDPLLGVQNQNAEASRPLLWGARRHRRCLDHRTCGESKETTGTRTALALQRQGAAPSAWSLCSTGVLRHAHTCT
ncbi:hypothetical protein MKX08_005422 [Trichoderma sp. CBMAI-0020]|nr:hypothetical protein MKX08_005422 [Trichoderma sp. CBMAI-0020]